MKGGRRSTTFTPERARAIALVREARRREARASGSSAVAGTRSPARDAGSRPAADLAVVEPLILDLVERDGVLTPRVMPAKLEPVQDVLERPRSDASPQAAPETRPEPRSPQAGPDPARVEAPGDPVSAPRRAPQIPARPALDILQRLVPQSRTHAIVKWEVTSKAERAPVADSGQADWERELAAMDPPASRGAESQPVPVPGPVAGPPDPALEALRIARARSAMGWLFSAIAQPHLVKWAAVRWQDSLVIRADDYQVCAGCAQRVARDRIEGHAVSAATKPTPKLRCVRWAFGIPESQA